MPSSLRDWKIHSTLQFIFQPLKDDGIVNATKNKLDEKEDKEKAPFKEVGEIVDCNVASGSTGKLSNKIYR